MNECRQVYFINDVPFSLGFGGKEVQLLSYRDIVNDNSSTRRINLLNHWDKNAIEEHSYLHLFGSSTWYYHLISLASQKKEIAKTIISTTFYHRTSLKLKIGSLLSRLSPLEDQYSYKKKLFDMADTLVVNSNAEGEQIVNNFGKNLDEKIVYIPNAIDDRFEELEDNFAFIEKYKLDAGYILSVCFLDERKSAINMLLGFLNSFDTHKKKLVLIGGFRFHSSKNRDIASKLIQGNPDKIMHIPFLPPGSVLLKSAYYNCSIHLLPSYVETPGISNLEALIFNKPIVVGDCLPVREYFGSLASYCEPGKISSISQAIKAALHHSAGYEGRQLVTSKYTYQAIKKAVIDLYE